MDIQQYFQLNDKTFAGVLQDAKTNLPKHLANGGFGEEFFNSVIPDSYINRMSCLVAYATIEHDYDEEYRKLLLQTLFDKLKNHKSEAIKKDASRAMCDINHKVIRYFETLKE